MRYFEKKENLVTYRNCCQCYAHFTEEKIGKIDNSRKNLGNELGDKMKKLI